MFGTFSEDRSYLTEKFRRQVCDPSTGLDNETLKEDVLALAEELSNLPRPVAKAKVFEYVARNVRIAVSPRDCFVGFGCWDRHDRPLQGVLRRWDEEANEKEPEYASLSPWFYQSGAGNLWKDFDHSVPDWDAVFELGFPGLLARIRQFRKERETAGSLDTASRAYFDGLEITYSAMLKMLERFRNYALTRVDESDRFSVVADCLNTLIHGAPTNTYEVLHLIYLYFMFSEHIDHMQVRSLGNLDRTLYPYVKRDMETGRFTEPQMRELFAYFLMQWASINNYWGHPFYLGGTKANGESEVNQLSYLILDVFDELSTCSPKIQLKLAPNTPVAFINKALDMIRRGNNSLVFVCEPGIKHAMMGIGYSAEEARTCDITGCYEFAVRARANRTGPGHVNMLKPVEWLFTGLPQDAPDTIRPAVPLAELTSFDAFYRQYINQLGDLIDAATNCAIQSERRLSEINPAQVFSGTIEHSLKTAKDAFHNGSEYNVTGILLAGFATTVDALMAVREFVFEKKEISLLELQDALANDWLGHEKLRRKILRSRNKFGNGIDQVDEHAEAIARFASNKINLRPNARGGFCVALMHAARQFIVLGEQTGTTPDGRRAGEEMSKNVSPTMGMDRNGVTALIRSVTRIDSAMFPSSFPMDVMLHPATTQGDEGLAAMRTLLKVYMDRHGIAIQFNVFDAKVLRDAQTHPEKYEGLQVRVCGWNVRFNDIARREQDEYIKRAENICV